MNCCAIAKTKIGSFDGTHRVREEYGGHYLALAQKDNVPVFSSIKYCPWCGTNLKS